MSQVFLSYSRTDEPFVRQLAAAFSDADAQVWIDTEDIPAGMKWSTAIQQGLHLSDAMIVVISPESMRSSNVEDEWQFFLDKGKPVIPVLYRPADIHFQLNRIQYIDFYQQPFETALHQLFAELHRRGIDLTLPEGVPPLPPTSHVTTPPLPVGGMPPRTADITVNRSLLGVAVGLGVVIVLLLGVIIGFLINQQLTAVSGNGQFAVDYPPNWQERQTPDDNEVVLTRDVGDGGTAVLRVTTADVPATTPANAAQTDEIANANVIPQDQNQITLGEDLPAVVTEGIYNTDETGTIDYYQVVVPLDDGSFANVELTTPPGTLTEDLQESVRNIAAGVRANSPGSTP